MTRQFQFYIVPTPIGNIKDITLRAIEVLKEVDIIACEDSRVTQKLLNHYDIKTKTISYHKYNEYEKVSVISDLLKSGKKVALVSDAGTPLICDPGSILLQELKKNNIKITALPGSCAVSTFLSQVPRNGEEYKFIGFLPKTDKQIRDIYSKNRNDNLVFYDSPNRLVKSLKIIQEISPDVKVAVGRELTKLFEEIVIDSIENVINHFSEEIKGEIVVMIFASNDKENVTIKEKIDILKDRGFKPKDISEILSALYDVNKNEIKSILY
ncbi:16S rRNA (cytidine(1402)-2'-O)-methyltransferase [bacterium]|nr:16S rRNA (cytidine(1402)-2'-O)-methyltransferase [bacterium]